MIALQAMLLQTDDNKIFLFPAWPKEWDVEFKLHVPNKTAVEAKFNEGKLQNLQVLPLSRAKDVIQ